MLHKRERLQKKDWCLVSNRITIWYYFKAETWLPGSIARPHTSGTDSITLSWGACRTIVVDPTTHKAQPRTPKICSLSRKIIWARAALQDNIKNQNLSRVVHKYEAYILSCLIIMLRAPRGVTNIAGANAYAAKLAISPTITVEIDIC